MRIKFLKDLPSIQANKNDINVLNERDEILGDTVNLCIGHGCKVDLKIGEDVELLDDKKTSEMLLRELYSDLKKAQKRWCNSESIDDAEEMWEEYPELIDRYVSEIEEVLEIPSTNLKIISAIYGDGSLIKDVKSILESKIEFNKLSIQVINSNMGKDPAPNRVKRLKVVYVYDNKQNEIIIEESKTLNLP